MLLTVGIAIILYVLWRRLTSEPHCLDVVQGPPPKPFVGNVLEVVNLSPTEIFKYWRDLARKYKDRYVLRIFNRRLLQLFHPDDVEVLLAHSKNITKNTPYVFLRPWLGTGLVLSTGSKWHKRRKILTPAFHFDILKKFLLIFEDKSLEVVKELQSKNGNEVDIFPIISNHALHVVIETAMGTRLSADKSAAAKRYKDSIIDVARLTLKRLNTLWLYNDFIFKISKTGRRYYQCIRTIDEFANNVIMKRKKQRARSIDKVMVDDIGCKKKMAMLDLLLDTEEKGEIDLEGVREEVHNFMFAGHETTGGAVTYALMMLADREEMQERIYEEYQLIMGGRERPTISDYAEMKYLEAVIKETLRLFSNPPRISRLVTEDFMLGDLLVKAGSEVAVMIYDLHHREDLYPDPEEFRPERFLNGEIKHPYAFIPFSAGLRNCIGQRFAMILMKSMLSNILQNFKLHPRHKSWRCALSSDLVLRPAEPIYISFSARQNSKTI